MEQASAMALEMARKARGIDLCPPTIGGTISEAVSIQKRLQPKPSSAPENDSEPRLRQALARDLERLAKLPARHCETAVERQGPWAFAAERVRASIGTGCLLALIGPRGTGKTRLAVTAVRASVRRVADALTGPRLVQSVSNPSELQVPVYTTAMGLFLRLRAEYREGGKTEVKAIEPLVRAPLLIIDEIQERGETAWEDRILTHIVDQRYAALRDTVVISNLKAADLAESVGASIASRMLEAGGLIECNWPSFRTAG